MHIRQRQEYSKLFKQELQRRMASKYGAAALKALQETSYIQNYIVNLSSKSYEVDDGIIPERLLTSFFAATSKFLSLKKIKDENTATALVLTDVNGTFKFAAVVEYHPNEDNPEEPGNWSYTMTFNQEDIDDLEKSKTVTKFVYGDTAFTSIFDDVAYSIGGVRIVDSRYMYDVCLITIDTLVQILDKEAVPDKEITVEMPDYFTATVAVEDDVKVMSITPSGHLKSVIKDDAILEEY